MGNLQLEVGSLAESVTVTAQGQEVATTTTAHQAVLDTKQVAHDLAARPRSGFACCASCRACSRAWTTDQFGGELFGTSVPNFQGRGGNTLYVDGVNGGDGGGGGNFSGATNIDAIAEVNVQMGAYTAEYGLKGGIAGQFHYQARRRPVSTAPPTGTCATNGSTRTPGCQPQPASPRRAPTGVSVLDAGRQHRRAGAVQDPDPQPQGQPDVLLLLAGRHRS